MGEIKKLNKYEIISTLGQGAMGVVYKAFDPIIERTVALKTIRKDALSPKDLEPLLTRFKHEAQAAGRLTHPGIVTVYDYGEDGETVYIAMEYVEGRELKEILDRNERLQLSFTVNLITQLLDALAYSHAHGVVHRDIKPGNIILLADGRIKVTDFGIAKIESSTLTQFGDVLGTPSYMSPEQFSGQSVDRRSDLFSAGVILYHLLTGEKPFPGNSMTTIMHRVINTIPPNVSELNFQIPAVFDQVVNKALAKKMAERFQSAEEFSLALKKALQADQGATENGGAEGPAFGYADQDEATVNLPTPGNTPASHPNPRVDPTAELHEKMEKIVDILQNRGLTSLQEEQTYNRGRSWVLAILVLISLSICSYLLWIIYSDDLNFEELQTLAQERKEEIISHFPGTLIKEDLVTELSGRLTKIPGANANQETTQVSARVPRLRTTTPPHPAPSGSTRPETSPAPAPEAAAAVPAIPDPAALDKGRSGRE